MKRVLTALVLLPIAVYGIFFAPPLVFKLILVALASLCFYEYAGLVGATGIPAPPWVCYLLGVAILLAPAEDMVFLGILAPLLLAIALRTPELAQGLPAAGAALLGLAYIYGAWRCGAALRLSDDRLFFFALAINWIGDSAAYFVGRAIGKRKLAPRISPGKSWEGAIGSVLFCAVLGAFYLYYLYGGPWWFWVLLSVGANIAGQLGDLAESAIKRGAGRKDSSHLLPGHGGWLDRLDSSLFSMPFVYVAQSLLARHFPFDFIR